MIFRYLSEEEVVEKVQELVEQGWDEEDAWSEVYSIDCNMDEDEEE